MNQHHSKLFLIDENGWVEKAPLLAEAFFHADVVYADCEYDARANTFTLVPMTELSRRCFVETHADLRELSEPGGTEIALGILLLSATQDLIDLKTFDGLIAALMKGNCVRLAFNYTEE